MRALVRTDERYEKVRALGVRSAMVVPIVARGHTIGAIGFSGVGRRRFSEEDLELAEQVGRRVGVSLDNAQLFDAERDARSSSDAAVERTRRLQQVTAALAAAIDAEEVAAVVVGPAAAALDAYAGSLSVPEPDGVTLRILHAEGYDASLIDRWRTFRLDAPTLIGRAIRTGEPTYVRTRADLARAVPDSPEPEARSRSWAAVPLVFENRILGALGFSFDHETELTADERAFAQAVAQQAAQALERTRLYERESTARRDAERALERTAALQRITERLSGDLDVLDVTRVLVDEMMAAEGAYAGAVSLLELDGETVQLIHRVGYPEDVAARYERFPLDSVSIVAAAVRTGQPQLYGDVAEMPEDGSSKVLPGTRAIAGIPLTGPERVHGTLVLSFPSVRTFTDEDREFLVAAARQCAQALERAELADAEMEARRKSEMAERRLDFLARFGVAMSGSLRYEETLERIAGLIVPEQADFVVAFLVGADGSIERVAAVHADPAKAELTREFQRAYRPDPSNDASLVARVIRSHEAAILPEVPPDFVERLSDDPELQRVLGGVGFRSIVVAPLMARQRGLGALALVVTSSDRRFDEDDLALAEQLGRRAGLALDNARLFEAERKARAEAEAAGAALEFLADASARFIRSLDPADLATTLTDLAVPRIGDGAFVYLVKDERPFAAAVRFTDPEKHALAQRLAGRTADAFGVLRAMETGRAELVEDARDDATDGDVRSLAPRSVVTVPLDGRRGAVGAVAIVTTGDRTLDAEDLPLVEELGRRAGLAVENATLYRERSEQARTLQESLLPPSLPAITGVRLAARYHPAGEGNDVGGDFYDVFEMGEDTWGVMMGDVCGKGPHAAALTALARYTVRTVAMQEDSPRSILTTLSEAIRREARDGRFATAVFARLNRTADGARLTVSCGGHPLPMVVRADGSLQAAGRPGMLLGVMEDPELSEVTVDLGPGDAIVLYTDGVIEHGPDLAFGEVGLATLLSGCAGLQPEEVAFRIEEWLAEVGPGRHHDDVAILVLSVVPQGTVQQVDLEPDPRSAATAREAIERWGENLPDDLVHDLRLMVSELVTNSVRHADVAPEARIGLRMWPGPELVRVEVSDGGPGFVPAPRHAASRQEAGWGLHLVGLLSDRWGVDRDGSGRVWFEVDLENRRHRAAQAARDSFE
jgi:GAF domain-containing protein/anti-sigma regulatory factor (Ser/Thr protein kinase)